MSGQLIITRAGLEASINAQNRGIKAALKWVSAGDSAYTATPEQTSLVNEIARVEFSEFKNLAGSQMQAVAKFSGPEEYAIRELGFWLDDGTLFGVMSSPNVTINFKPAGGHCLQPFTLDFSALPTDSVTVVVGTENLNILIDEEFTIMARTQVDIMHRQIKQEIRLLELEKSVFKA